jgi:hypothetical protein
MNTSIPIWEMDSSIHHILLIILCTSCTADVTNKPGTRPPSIRVSVDCTGYVTVLLNARL